MKYIDLIHALQDKNIADPPERDTEVDKLVFGGVIRNVPDVNNLGRRIWQLIESSSLDIVVADGLQEVGGVSWFVAEQGHSYRCESGLLKNAFLKLKRIFNKNLIITINLSSYTVKRQTA